MAPICLCEATFGSISALRRHAIHEGHFFQYNCDRFFRFRGALLGHLQESGAQCKFKDSEQLTIDYTQGRSWKRSYCGLCPNTHFDTTLERDQHIRRWHKACPTCLQVFGSDGDRHDHQKAAGHSYCTECDLFSNTLKDLMDHVRSQTHLDKFPGFDNLTSASNGHRDVNEGRNQTSAELTAITASQLARAEELNLWCEECNKSCATVRGLHAHKTSSKHLDPFVYIKCSCDKEFHLVSAFLQHLESSSCRTTGVTRDKLNAIVYKYDSGRSVTMAEHSSLVGSAITGESQSSIAPRDSASNIASCLKSISLNGSRVSEVDDNDSDNTDSTDSDDHHILAPDDSGSSSGSTSSGVLLTPEASDTISSLCGRGVVLDSSASITAHTLSSDSSSDRVSILTPPSSNPSAEEGMLTPSSGSSSDEDVLLTPSASTVSSDDGMRTPSSVSSSNAGVLLTPSSSMVASGEWSFLESSHRPTPASTSIDGSSTSTVHVDTTSGLPSCSKCERTFATTESLRQHINSGVHGPKLFHCPSFADAATTLPDQEFTTFSGLVRHVEDGHCSVGDGALAAITEVLKGPIQGKLGMNMKVLGEHDEGSGK